MLGVKKQNKTELETRPVSHYNTKCIFTLPSLKYIPENMMMICAKSLVSDSACSWTVALQVQARILEWVAILSSRVSSGLRDQTRISYVSYIGRQVLYH